MTEGGLPGKHFGLEMTSQCLEMCCFYSATTHPPLDLRGEQKQSPPITSRLKSNNSAPWPYNTVEPMMLKMSRAKRDAA